MQTIDGSVLEGGGQIIRMAVCFSALLKKPIKLIKIRAGRQKGGLAAQHLKGIELVKEICSGKVEGAAMGSTEVEFSPGQLRGGEYSADAITAGVALLLQVSLPLTFFCNAPVILNLKGGTNAEMAPQIDFITEILRPNIEKFGATFDFDLYRRGYFPKGGGHCKISVKPINYLNPVQMVDFGEVSKFFGWSFVAGSLPVKLADEMSTGAKNSLKNLNLNKHIDIEVYKETPEMARDNCSGIILGCETTTNCILGGSALGSRKESSFETGRRAAKELVDAIQVSSCVDHHVQDQLIVFMALAKGTSRIRCNLPLTLHTKTAIYIAELMTNVKFNIIENGSTCILECTGIGLENSTL